LPLLFLLLLIAPAFAAGPVVMFDESHDQKFLIEEQGDLHLSKFAGLFKEAGFTVKTSTKAITDEGLAQTDVLIISGAFSPFTSEEAESVMRFIAGGGKLCLMLHIPGPVTPLLGRLKVYPSNGVILKQNEFGVQQKELVIKRFESHLLFNSIRSFTIYGAWALLNENEAGRAIAHTGSDAWIDLNRSGILDSGDARQEFGVVVAGDSGRGSYALFGDDALFQNKFLVGENLMLAKNLVRWLQK
jgi:hypothetical protein